MRAKLQAVVPPSVLQQPLVLLEIAPAELLVSLLHHQALCQDCGVPKREKNKDIIGTKVHIVREVGSVKRKGVIKTKLMRRHRKP